MQAQVVPAELVVILMLLDLYNIMEYHIQQELVGRFVPFLVILVIPEILRHMYLFLVIREI
jgi:hypothetical protein